MSKKAKKIVWSKTKGKLISPNILKPHTGKTKSTEPGEKADAKTSKLKAFAKNFDEQIKKAAREGG